VSAAARVHHLASAAAYAGIPNASSLGQREALWRSVMSNSERWPYVVEADDQIVGVLIVGPNERGDAGELYVIYVHPEWWGTGAAQRLIECAHEQLGQRFSRAALTVLASNTRARRFYQRNGWELSELTTQLHFGGIPTEVAIYGKRFS
jgi:GNAT superfamily N-acetyltransferase